MLVLVVVTMGSGARVPLAACQPVPSDARTGGQAASRQATARLPCQGGTQSGQAAGGVAIGSAAKFLLMLVAMAMVFGYVRWVLVPVLRERALINLSQEYDDLFEHDEVLRAAAEANPLAWEPDMLRGVDWQRTAMRGHGPDVSIAYERAAEAYAAAIARQPALREAYLYRARCLAPEDATVSPEAMQAALECLASAVRLYPAGTMEHLQLARMLERLGRPRQALEEYRRTVDLDDRMPAEFRRLTPEGRRFAEAAIARLEESLAAPAAGP
jgi:tetratricopeptide (TPR) repeat protein